MTQIEQAAYVFQYVGWFASRLHSFCLVLINVAQWLHSVHETKNHSRFRHNHHFVSCPFVFREARNYIARHIGS